MRLFFFFSLLAVNSCLYAQKIPINLGQADPRFNISAKRYWSSLGENEEYRIYIENLTNDEYSIVVEVSLNLACHGVKNFVLGYNKSISLKPYQKWDSENGSYAMIWFGQKDCRIKEGDSYTLFKDLTYRISNVKNITQLKKEEEAKTKQLEEEKIKKAKEEEVKRAKALEKERQETAKKKEEERKLTDSKKTQTEQSNKLNAETPSRLTNNKNSFTNNSASFTQTNTTQTSSTKVNEPIKADPLNRLEEKIKYQQAKNDEIFKNIDNHFNKLANDQRTIGNFNESISYDKQRLEEARQLSGNYNSVEDIEREFASKMSSIRGITYNIESQQNAKLNYAVTSTFNANATELAIGQGLNLVGNIFNSAKAAKDAREAQESLRLQREAEIKKFEEAKKRAIVELRNNLIKRFPDASIPFQLIKTKNEIIYFFSYIIENNKLEENKPIITVTNIFPVSKFEDGSFPYKSSILNKLTGIAKGNISLIGHFESLEKAEEIRNVFIKLAESSQLTVSQFQLNKISQPSNGTLNKTQTDFWENGKKIDSSQIKNKQIKDAFWDN